MHLKIIHELNVDNLKEFKDHATTKKKFTYQTAWRKLDEASLEKAYKKENAVGAQHESPRISTRLGCVECGLRTLNKDGTISPAITRLVGPSDTLCFKGHDLSKKGTYIVHDSSESFTDDPRPVRIP